ncbi:MAG: universal stress protein [Burkholderiales bacterium]|nr:universal stress protein [Burkholderiales bacterium]
MKILIPVDGSAFSKRMRAYRTAHDEWLGSQHRYTVLHAVPALPARATAVIDKAVLKTHYAEEAERVFKPIRSFFDKQGIPAEFNAKVGHAADVIARVARDGKFDLLLMGSHGHTSLGGLVLGSVTNRVLANCNTPALIIR